MRDFCHSRPMSARVLRQTDLMDRMIERMELDPAEVVRLHGGRAWYEARSRCIACQSERQCRDWLAQAPPRSQPPVFCPGVQFFRRYDDANRKCGEAFASTDLVEKGANR